MRVLHILDHSLPLQSGYAFRTLAILREQRALGWQTLQLTTPRQARGSAPYEDVDGWRFHRTPLAPSPLSRVPGMVYMREMAATARRIRELAAVFRPDVLHAHSPVLNVVPALWAGRRLGLPVIYEVRALWEDAAVDHGTTQEGSLRYRASRMLETFALRRADGITTICEGLRGEIAARGIPGGRITVIPNGVDTNAFRAGTTADRRLRAQLGLEDRTTVGFAGSFYGYEGLDLLLDALGLADRVIFTGRVPHAEMQRYYDLIDVLAYPRRPMRLTDLVTPLKPLEAMAQGRMLVASDVGGHRELIQDNHTGYLFAAGNADALAGAIESVLARRDEWPRIREQARRFVEQERTWARSVARYADVYAGLRAPAVAAA